jgi:hypothetical protein
VCKSAVVLCTANQANGNHDLANLLTIKSTALPREGQEARCSNKDVYMLTYPIMASRCCTGPQMKLQSNMVAC